MPDDINKNQEESYTKVIKGSAKIEKLPLGKRIVKFLFTDRLDSMTSYIGQYVIVPALRNLFYNTGNQMLQFMCFGGQGSQMAQNSGSYIQGYGYLNNQRPQFNYNAIRMMANPSYAQPGPGIYPQRVAYNDVSFDSRDDAYVVLDRMNREIARYGRVRLADFYTFAGITGQEGNWTLQGNGWYNLADAHPMMRTDGRWIIEFPPVQVLR